MKFLEWLGNSLLMPVEKTMEWFNQLDESITEWFVEFMTDAAIGITGVVIEGVGCIVVLYTIYCACRIMCTSEDEKFSKYVNNTMIGGVCYFFAKYGGKIIENYLLTSGR